MRTLAAASLSCLLVLGGCTYSSLVSKLSTKPTAPRSATSTRTTSAPKNASAPRTASASKTASAAGTATTAGADAAPAVESRPSLGIPPEEIPSPGACRLWLPDVAPEQQNAPGSCTAVQKKVPAGAWVLHRSVEKTNEVAVNVYRSRWPLIVSETRYFDYWTGRFLRAE